MTPNKHKVTQKTWHKWTENARRLFNYMLEATEDQLSLAGGVDKVPAYTYGTIQWNAAFIAASQVSFLEKSFIEQECVQYGKAIRGAVMRLDPYDKGIVDSLERVRHILRGAPPARKKKAETCTDDCGCEPVRKVRAA